MRVFVELVSFHELKGDSELFLGALVFLYFFIGVGGQLTPSLSQPILAGDNKGSTNSWPRGQKIATSSSTSSREKPTSWREKHKRAAEQSGSFHCNQFEFSCTLRLAKRGHLFWMGPNWVEGLRKHTCVRGKKKNYIKWSNSQKVGACLIYTNASWHVVGFSLTMKGRLEQELD